MQCWWPFPTIRGTLVANLIDKTVCDSVAMWKPKATGRIPSMADPRPPQRQNAPGHPWQVDSSHGRDRLAD